MLDPKYLANFGKKKFRFCLESLFKYFLFVFRRSIVIIERAHRPKKEKYGNPARENFWRIGKILVMWCNPRMSHFLDCFAFLIWKLFWKEIPKAGFSGIWILHLRDFSGRNLICPTKLLCKRNGAVTRFNRHRRVLTPRERRLNLIYPRGPGHVDHSRHSFI